jgi:tetratricopeptide (TPR) repeat protein
VHFERGRDATRAVGYLEKAAMHCTRRGAYREALATLRRALEVTPLLPDTPERSDRVLFLTLRLGASLLVAEDYADPEVGATFQRCRELAERAEALPPLLTALAGLHSYHSARGEVAEAVSLVPRAVALAERLPLPQATLVAHTCGAWSHWSRGELVVARDHATRAIAARPADPMSFPSTFDLVGLAFGTSAFIEAAMGNVATARAVSDEGLAWSRRTARPVDRALALTLAGMLSAFMDDPAVAAERAREGLAVAEEHGYRQWTIAGRIVAAWAAAVAQPEAHRRADVMTHIEEYKRMGLRGLLAPFLCLAARAHVGTNTAQAAIDLLDDAESCARESGELWYEAERHRVRGEIVQALDPREAEASFRRAIAVARAQGARLWELRATVSLATLWSRGKKRVAARQLLETVLSSFVDDVDAPDLLAARALRARLV